MNGPSSDSDTESQPICVECGVCCSGALFDTVPLAADEERSLADLFAVERIDERPQFRLRCPHLSDCRCTVYAKRPEICRQYRCKTLIELSDGAIAREEALRRIAAIRQAIDDLEPHLLSGETMGEARERRRKLSQSGDRMDRDQAAFMLKSIALDVLLDRFLRSEKGRHIKVHTDKRAMAS